MDGWEISVRGGFKNPSRLSVKFSATDRLLRGGGGKPLSVNNKSITKFLDEYMIRAIVSQSFTGGLIKIPLFIMKGDLINFQSFL